MHGEMHKHHGVSYKLLGKPLESIWSASTIDAWTHSQNGFLCWTIPKPPMSTLHNRHPPLTVPPHPHHPSFEMDLGNTPSVGPNQPPQKYDHSHCRFVFRNYVPLGKKDQGHCNVEMQILNLIEELI